MPSDDPTLAASLTQRLLRAGYHQQGDGDALLARALDETDPRYRVLAVRGLVRRGLMDRDRWRRVLGDRDAEVRREALEQWAHSPSEDVLGQVIDSLEDPDALVVDAAAFALGEHVDPRSVEALCRVAREHDDARCRESAIAALGAIGDDRARATILAALEDKAPVRRRAIVALANFEGPDVDAALDKARDDRDWQVRSAVDQLRREDQT